MEKGEIRFHGPTAELLERPDILRSVFLEGARPHGDVDGRAGDADDGAHGDRGDAATADVDRRRRACARARRA